MAQEQDSKQGHWKYIGSEQGPDLDIFKVRYDWVENPRNAYALKAVVLEIPDWVKVVAITPEGDFVVVDQYRFGIGSMTTEIPAGVIEAGETSEQAAKRELQEETGYTGEDWTYLGWVQPNPAFQNNRCHQWLVRNVQKTHTSSLDEGENIVVRLLSQHELRTEIQSGKIRNVLALAALSRVMNVWEPAFSEETR